MSAPTYHDAAQRAIVRLPDQRSARLVFMAKHGQTAKVQLQSGAFLSLPASTLTIDTTPSPKESV